jgi:hypothetical protein
LIGYFTEWSASAGARLILSNATYFEAPDVYIDRSEDRVTAALDASIFTSPHRTVVLEASLFADQAFYLSRNARLSTGSYSTARLYVMDAGAAVSAEWTPNEVVFFVVRGNGGYTYSNDPFVRGWDIRAGVGVLVSF